MKDGRLYHTDAYQIKLNGKWTTICLEPEFYKALQQAAMRSCFNVDELFTQIVNGNTVHPRTKASAVRVWLMLNK